MDIDALKIYIDRLSGGHRQLLNEEFEASLLDMGDETLRFQKPIKLSGEAYIASDELIIHVNIAAQPETPCSVCADWAPWDLDLDNVYITVPLDEIKGAVFDISEMLREEILVNIPYVIECEGNCPKRKTLGTLIKDETPEEDGYRPFADL